MAGPMGGHGRMGGRGGYPMTKEKADKKALMKIVVYGKRYLPAIMVAVVCAIGGAVTTIIGPDYISELTNTMSRGLMTGIDMDEIMRICITLGIIYITGVILNYIQQFITATVTQYTSKRLRTDIDKKINKLPLRFFDSSTKGDILSRVTNDVDTISQTLSQSIASLVSSIALFFGVLFMMFKTNVVLSIITIITSFIGFIFMGAILKKSQKYFNAKQQCLGEMNGQVEEVYTNHNIVKAFGGQPGEVKKFEETNEKLYSNNWRSQFLSGMMMPVMGFVGNLAYAMIFIIGVLFINSGNDAVTLGTIMAFVIYARLFTQPLQNFSQSMTSFQQASAASKRVFEMLESEDMPDESGLSKKLSGVKGNVEFRNVKFGYLKDKTIIHNFSAKLTSGQKVAIVGPTGAGKTTMVNLLMKFYDVDEGDILIDDCSIKEMKREEVHDLFDMILQDTWLFSGTIRDNLVYNKENVSDDELNRAVKAVGLKHFIDTLPKGYDTELNEALNLSEGQKQQLTIARAIIKDAPLLILDEATSSVDTRTELVIQRAMDELTKGRTSFVIAHRLSTIKNADVILVMRDGDIVEVGNHNNLLEQNGFYAELYKAQFAH